MLDSVQQDGDLQRQRENQYLLVLRYNLVCQSECINKYGFILYVNVVIMPKLTGCSDL